MLAACHGGTTPQAPDTGGRDAGTPDAPDALDASDAPDVRDLPDVPDSGLFPNLWIDRQALLRDVVFEDFEAEPRGCAAIEGCVTGTGTRRLLRFTVEVINDGDVDLVAGNPADNPRDFVFSPCHGHYHFTGFAGYELLARSGTVAVSGRKQAYCMRDTRRRIGAIAPNTSARYDCDNQGISRGWSDVYPFDVDCQWLDVTGVPPGEYRLRVVVNPEGKLPESNRSDNTAEIAVRIP